MKARGHSVRRWVLTAALAAGVAGGGGGVAWWANEEERARRDETARWRAVAGAARARVETLSEEVRWIAAEAKLATEALEAVVEAKASAGRRAEEPDTVRTPSRVTLAARTRALHAWVAQERERRERPAEQNADARRHRKIWRDGSRDFWRALRLEPAQVERWLDAEEAHFLAATDLETVGRAQRLVATDPAVTALEEEINQRYEARLRAEFGDDAWRRWEDFRQVRWAREVASAVGGMAAMTGVALTRAQGEQLARVIADETERNGQGKIAVPSRVDWAAVDARAKVFLTDAQWELFRTVEAPGRNGGGARFVTMLNDALLLARRQDEAAATAGRAEKPAGP